MNVSWIFFFSFLLLKHTVSVECVPVDSFIGESVTLNCSFVHKPKTVFWRYKDSRTVCNIIDGKADFDDQDTVYKGRVTISQSEIEKGNFSIMLSDVKKSDSGLYTCTTPNIKTLTLELNVTARLTAPGNGESPRRADGLLTFLLGCALLYSLTF